MFISQKKQYLCIVFETTINHKFFYRNEKDFSFATAALVLLACDNAQEPETQQTPVTKAQAKNAFFLNPIAFNGTFIETGS